MIIRKKLIVFPILFLMFTMTEAASISNIANTMPPLTIQASSRSVVVSTSTTALTFDLREGFVSSIRNIIANEVVSNVGYPLWSIATNSGSLSPSNLDPFSYTIIQGDVNQILEMKWSVFPADLNVAVNVTYDDPTNGLGFRISVQNLNSSLVINKVSFPYFGGIAGFAQSQQLEKLAIPNDDGLIINDPRSALQNRTMQFQYPGPLSMQFVTLYGEGTGGFYYGVEDPESTFKGFLVSGSTYSHNLIKMSWFFYPDIIDAGNSFNPNFSVVFAAFRGFDWKDGALFYRNWALKQWYVKQGPIQLRSDIPSWFKNIQVVAKVGLSSEIMNAPSFISSTFGIHDALLDVWGWNRDGFDHGYPELFPAREGDSVIGNATRIAHAEGAKVIFYTNGRSVDMETATFLQNKQFMTVNASGQPYEVNYDNNALKAAFPDPSTPWWKQEVANFTTRVVKLYNADGAFLDQVALNPPVIDYSSNRTHPIGGGTWWMKAEQDLLTFARDSMRSANPNAILTSEGVNEVYLPYVDGFWVAMTHNVAGDPNGEEALMFSFVYNGYSIIYSLAVPPSNTDLFKYQLGFSLQAGYIPHLDPRLSTYAHSQYTSNELAEINTTLHARATFEDSIRNSALEPLSYTGNESLVGFNWTGFKFHVPTPSVLVQAYRLYNGSVLLLGSSRSGTVASSIRLNSIDGFYPLELRIGGQTMTNQPINVDLNGQTFSYLSVIPLGAQLDIFGTNQTHFLRIPGQWLVYSLHYEYSNKTIFSHISNFANVTTLAIFLSDASAPASRVLLNGTAATYQTKTNGNGTETDITCQNCHQIYLDVSFESFVTSTQPSLLSFLPIIIIALVLAGGAVFLVRRILKSKA